MCLEEMLCCTIPEGALYYGETRRRLRVSFSEELRREVRTCNPLSFSPCPAANRNRIIKMLRMACEKRILSAQYRSCICVYLLSLPHGERGLKKDRLALHMAGQRPKSPDLSAPPSCGIWQYASTGKVPGISGEKGERKKRDIVTESRPSAW